MKKKKLKRKLKKLKAVLKVYKRQYGKLHGAFEMSKQLALNEAAYADKWRVYLGG